MDYYPDTVVIYFQRPTCFNWGFLICIRFLRVLMVETISMIYTDIKQMETICLKKGWMGLICTFRLLFSK